MSSVKLFLCVVVLFYTIVLPLANGWSSRNLHGCGYLNRKGPYRIYRDPWGSRCSRGRPGPPGPPGPPCEENKQSGKLECTFSQTPGAKHVCPDAEHFATSCSCYPSCTSWHLLDSRTCRCDCNVNGTIAEDENFKTGAICCKPSSVFAN